MKRKKLLKVAMFLIYCIVCFTLPFFIQAAIRHACPLCQTTLSNGRPYLWDIQSGAAFPICQYTGVQSSIFWLDGVNHLPQEVYSGRRYAVARFPEQPGRRPLYCSSHCPESWENRFLVLVPHSGFQVTFCVPRQGGRSVGDCLVSQRRNCAGGYWELLIHW